MEEFGTHVIIRQRTACPSPITSSTVHIDMPNRTDGTLSKVPVTLHMPDETMAADESNTIETAVLHHQEATDTPSSVVLSDINLDDFVDVVTTYKCKFCPFTCPWKSGLISHIRSLHLLKPITTKAVLAMELPSDEAVKRQQVQLSGSIPPVPVSPPVVAEVQETHMFLCGQCHQGFDSFDNCKNHILAIHQAGVEAEETTDQPPLAKVKIPRKPRKKLVHYEIIDEDDKSDEEVVPERLGKRMVRPPRALLEDYVVTSDKRKYAKRQRKSDPDVIVEDPNVVLLDSDSALTDVFRCEVGGCEQTFSTQDKLEYHIRCHPETTEEDQAPPAGFQCPECTAEFRPRLATWPIMSQHLWEIHQLDLDTFTRDTCPLRVSSQIKKRRTHRYTCQTKGCAKTFMQMRMLLNHQRSHQVPAQARLPTWVTCEVCGKRLGDDKSLRKHVAAVHQNDRPFVCPYCPHSSARRSMLILHARQHTGEKPFACDVCDYVTCDHNSLRRHKMRHSGEKPYKCPHCPYACIQAISYKTHLRSKHQGMEGLYECSMCNFRSVNKDNYVIHVGNHQMGLIEEVTAAESQSQAATTNQSDAASSQLFFGSLGVVSRQQQNGEKTALESDKANDATIEIIESIDEEVVESFDVEGQQTITFEIPEGYGLDELQRAQLVASGAASDGDQPIYVTIDQSSQETDHNMDGQLVADEHVMSTVDDHLDRAADDELAQASYQLISISNGYAYEQ